MSKYFVNRNIQQINQMSAVYHKEWVSNIKKNLGKNCSFLQHVRKVSNGVTEYFLEARFLVKGGAKKVTFKLEGTPSDISNQNYLDLQTQLLDYARTEKII